MNPSIRAAVNFFAAALMLSISAARGDDTTLDYKISPRDILIISVVGEKDLLQECKVTSSGVISYAWLSNVEVAGKTEAEVEKQLRDLLDKDYLVEPTVHVAVKVYDLREVSVLGFVGKPGSVPLPAEQRLTIVEAISRAGGITRGGDRNKIHFTRRGKEKEVFEFDKLNRESDPEKMIYVEPGDVIEVKERLF